ncbi:peptide ABC transporter substrate-binding protein [Fluviispira multicolorata]|uniref:Oligopeptide ABC transporter substrate-binding protein OppA n=1 Tax=Fluviispira multicolorata TaxID=2654512 RepID=A0A833JEN9_9BACT|nr:peptide ABC transporter substrate-binding protein [Fluviispira multicolorata]KAB8033306.1 oligopeptide ABC transporter substrate-binding protein OppA [Fluviispira multicolorata]
MVVSKNKLISSSILAALLFSSYSYAADVPKNVVLAKKQIFNKGNGAELPTLDPQKVEDKQGNNIAIDLFEGLVRDDNEGIVRPAGAHKWEITPDGLTYTFHLRKNAKWSNGDTVTAHDYVYGIQRLSDPKVASTYAFLTIALKNGEEVNEGRIPVSSLGVKALDDYTLQIQLARKNPAILDTLVMRNFSPINKKVMEKYGEQYFQPGKLVTNGAYMLTYWRVGDKLTMVKNPHYWNANKTVIEEVNYFPIQNVNTEEQMYLSGQLDMTNDISTDQFDKLKKKLGSEVRSDAFLASYFFSFNNQVEPFKDNLKLREALNLVIDRNVITQKVTRRGEISSNDIAAQGVKNYNLNVYSWSNLSMQERIKTAKKLYAEAGYSEKNPLTLKILYSTNENFKKLVLTVASMWKDHLGVKVELENQEWKVFLKTRQKGDFQVAFDRWNADYNDINTFADLLRSDNIQNNAKYRSEIFDKMLKKADYEMNVEKRKKYFEEALSYAMNEYPIVPLYTAVSVHLVKKYVGGYTGKNPLDNTSSFDLYMIEPSKVLKN